MHMKKISVFAGIFLLLVTGVFVYRWNMKGVSSPLSAKKTDTIQVVVSILPQTDIVKRIGGEQVDIQALIPSGYSPHTYDPTPGEMAFVHTADVYFRIGHIGFEKTRLEDIRGVNPDMRIVDTSAHNTLRTLENHTHEDESHEENNHEHEEEIDPHIWLAPMMVREQARIITDTLSDMDPDNKALYANNLKKLENELMSLDKTLDTAFTPIRGKTMLVYHPAFGYLADAYGFIQQHFQYEGKDPTIKQVQEVIQLARSQNIKAIFVQKQFNTESAQTIAQQIGGVVVEIDPLAPDYLENMRRVAKTITDNLQ